MKTYSLNIYSTKIHNWTIAFGLIIGMIILFSSAFLKTPLLGIAFFFGFVGVGIILAKKLCQAKANISISEEGFNLQWIENFKILKRNNTSFNFSDLQEYVIEGYGQYYFFKFKNSSGLKEKFEFNIRDQNTETLGEFLDEFENAINSYNSNTNNVNKIQIGKNIWQTLPTKVMAGVLILTIVFLSFNLLKTDFDYIKGVGLLFLIIYTIGYFTKLINENRKINDYRN